MERPAEDRRRTVGATPADEAWPDGGYAAPGATYVDRDDVYPGLLLFACPGCGRMGGIRVGAEKPPDRPSWRVEAGEVKDPGRLTLSPSIYCAGCCGWHGYLRGGVFSPC